MRWLVGALLLSLPPVIAKAAGDDCADDPKRTHLSRIIAVDSTDGPLYGQIVNAPENKSKERTISLHDHEIVLTFDDGPLAANTMSILETLDRHCVKATFFSVGRMAVGGAKTLQEVFRRGHTIGTHSWSHPRAMHLMPGDDVKLEIEKGFMAVSQAVGKPIAPFFRFPGFRDSADGVTYLASRNISTWSVDVVSGDADPGATSATIARDSVSRLRRLGKGIILFHDIKKTTAEALDGILTELEKDGFKFVHVVSNTSYVPNPELLNPAGPLRGAPENATITGQWRAHSQEKLNDGNVDIMDTEWIDLNAIQPEPPAPKKGN
jgi:peptidoglycan-N-acetylglucosamine deacetylase